MADPIDLNARRQTRIPQPEGDPLIVMPMDSDQIIFRDQAALDEYVAGATDEARAELDNLRERVTALADELENPPFNVGQIDRAYVIVSLRAAIDGNTNSSSPTNPETT